MIRSDEYWLDLEERKARGDLRAYGLGDWLRIVFLMNAAQLLLVMAVVVGAGVAGLAAAGGVLGLGPLTFAERAPPRAAPISPRPAAAVVVAPADPACRAFCAESGLRDYHVDVHGCCLCADALGNVVKSLPAPP